MKVNLFVKVYCIVMLIFKIKNIKKTMKVEFIDHYSLINYKKSYNFFYTENRIA